MTGTELRAVPAQTMAKLMAVKPAGLRRWVSDGCPVNANGALPAPKVIAWRLRRAAEDESADWCRLVRREFGGRHGVNSWRD